MSRTGVNAVCLAVLITACSQFVRAAAPEAKSPPKTVVDYYYLLPDDYFEIKREARKELLEPANKPVVDIPHGYLLAPGDGAQPSLEVALFKRKGGDYIVAVCHNQDEENGTFLDFFFFRNHKLLKVNGLLPKKVDSNLVYKLPRTGTTIEVRKANGKLADSFTWNGEKFQRAK